jgi:hypothetical protein
MEKSFNRTDDRLMVAGSSHRPWREDATLRNPLA